MILASGPISPQQAIAHALIVLAIVPAIGLSIGALKYRGLALGPTAVVFVGIIFGHFDQRIDPTILGFARDFGLVMFIFSIGLQMGPGFPSVMREQGLRLNLLATLTVCAGIVTAVALGAIARVDQAATLGLLAGATTNTPSLGAIQQALATIPGVAPDRAALPGLAYAVTYPAGVVGIIGSIVFLRWIFHIDPAQEAIAYREQQRARIEPVERMTVVVENAAVDRLPLASYRTARYSSGDYYDIGVLSDGRLGVFIADVSGKGAAAAVIMAMLRAIVHDEVDRVGFSGPAALLDYANDRLRALGLSRRSAFVTAFCGLLNVATGEFTYSCAGHNPPRLLRATRRTIISLDAAKTFPLGLVDEPNTHAEATTSIMPGDLLLFYTDGITEARSPAREFFGPERLDRLLCQLPHPLTADTAIEAISTAVNVFEGHQPLADDQTLLALIAR